MRTAKLIIIVAVAGLMTALSSAPAEARLFEPQANWLASGELCVASRRPPGRRWQVSPPRVCAAPDVETASLTPVKLEAQRPRHRFWFLRTRQEPAPMKIDEQVGVGADALDGV